jgi:hypothetical protein
MVCRNRRKSLESGTEPSGEVVVDHGVQITEISCVIEVSINTG